MMRRYFFSFSIAMDHGLLLRLWSFHYVAVVNGSSNVYFLSCNYNILFIYLLLLFLIFH